MVALETPTFQAYRGTEPPRFVNDAELEYAKILDYYGVPWMYEPHTFVLERDDNGRVVEAFTPDFYLPEQGLYLEVTVMKQALVTRKNRKLRKLRQLYPEVKIKLFYERDFERIAGRYVVVVDEIVDTGLTMHYLTRALSLRAPGSLAIATLFDRPYRRLVDDLPIRYVGFTVPDEFFVGYGFDLDERWRNLPDLHLLREV